jgi:hypothetical protein
LAFLRQEYAGIRFLLAEIEAVARQADNGIRFVPNTHPIETVWNLWGLFGAPENRGHSVWIYDVEFEGVVYKLVFARMSSKVTGVDGGLQVGLVDVGVGARGAAGDHELAEKHFKLVDEGIERGDDAVMHELKVNAVLLGAGAAISRGPVLIRRMQTLERLYHARAVGQVAHGGTDLSRAALAYRMAEGIKGGRNIAVFEYRAADGTLKTITRASVRRVGHAERIIAKELEKMGVDPSQVTRIYSELQPCNLPGAYCGPYIARTFPNAKITWSFAYGAIQESRKAGIDALKALTKELERVLGP